MFGKILLAYIGLAAAEETAEEGTKETFVKNLKKTACYHYSDLEYYDFSDLQLENPYSKLAADGKTYTWNLCQTQEFCSTEESFAASWNGDSHLNCVDLSGS